jgi:alanine racemase
MDRTADDAASHASDPPTREASAILSIDLAAIVSNWRELARRAAPAECGAVVKADAYGCGLTQVAAALARAACRTFFVAHIAEGVRLRTVAADSTIYVLNGLLPGTASAFAEHDLRPVISSVVEFEEWRAFQSATGWSGGAALHFDTGMNRLGLRGSELAEARSRAQGGGITLIMSHFACADEPGHPTNARQLAAFQTVRSQFPNIAASLANSSGIFLGPDAHHQLVRPGAALYGVNPTPGHLNLMQTVVRLDGRVLQVRTVPAGETVGYGATWTAKRPSRIAVVAVGYADGFPRAAGSSDLHAGAEAIVAGHRCQLAGRISMDLIAVDVTDLPVGVPARGESVSLLGEETGVDDLASHAGTIGYEILTSLGRRYRRVYRGL